MDAEHVEPEVERLRDDRSRLIRRQAELRAVVARADRLVGVGVDAERDADEHALDTRVGRKPRLVGSVEHDRRPARRRAVQERAVLVVSVDDQLLAVEPGRARERELALGGDVRADALVSEQSQHRDVGECLRAEEDAAVLADGRAERPRARANRLLAEDDERRPVLLRERRGTHSADRERRTAEGGGIREQR